MVFTNLFDNLLLLLLTSIHAHKSLTLYFVLELCNFASSQVNYFGMKHMLSLLWFAQKSCLLQTLLLLLILTKMSVDAPPKVVFVNIMQFQSPAYQYASFLSLRAIWEWFWIGQKSRLWRITSPYNYLRWF